MQTRAGLDDAVKGILKAAVETARETESEHRAVDVAEALARARDVRKAVELVNPLPLNRDYGLDHVASAMAQNSDFAGASGWRRRSTTNRTRAKPSDRSR